MIESFEFFIDRSLGRHQVPQALREAGLTVHTMAEVYGEQAGQRLKDDVWLEDVGRRGWIVLMKDDAIPPPARGARGPDRGSRPGVLPHQRAAPRRPAS